MNPLVPVLSESVLLFLASLATASLLVAGAGLAIAQGVRRASLPLRHAVLASTLAAVAAGPVLLVVLAATGVGFLELSSHDSVSTLPLATLSSVDQPPLPASDFRNVAAEPVSEPVIAKANAAAKPIAVANVLPAATNGSVSTPGHTWEWTWTDLGRGLVLVWAAGIVWSLSRLALGLWQLRSLWASCREVSNTQLLKRAEDIGRAMGLPRTPAVYESSAVVAPLTLGLVRPCIVVPTEIASQLTVEQLQGLLRHEIGHIVRRDAYVGLLQRLALVIYWWNPLVRNVSAAIAEVREQICDDLATGSAARGDSYASMLVELARQAVYARPLPATIGMFDGSRREFSRRVERLLDESRNVTTALEWRTKAVVAVITFGLVALSGVASIEMESVAAEAEAKSEPDDAKKNDKKPADDSGEPPAVAWPKELWGVIHDEVGRPIEGAKVRLALEKIHEYQIGRWDETLWSQEVTTGKDGVYRFSTAELPELRHRPFMLMMSATADGYADLRNWNWYSRRDTKVDAHWSDMKLLPGRVVHGRVVNHVGQPVPGAIVKATGDFGINQFGRSQAWNPRKTDEDGKFSFAVPSKLEGPIELWVVSPDWAPQRVSMPKQGDELSDVRLQPGGRVSGTVTLEDGSPVAGVVVTAKSVDDGTLPNTGFAAELAVKTDAQGRYQLPPIDGIYKVYLSQAEETNDRLGDNFVVGDVPPPPVSPAKVAVSGHQEVTLDFHAGPTQTVRGAVRWPDGKPVADCQVQASFLPDGFGTGIWLDDTRTDAEGNYAVELPKPIDGISICVTGAYDSKRVWHFGSPAEGVKAEQKSLQFIGLGRLTGDVEGIDWVLKSKEAIPEMQSAQPQAKDAATLELEKLERRYKLMLQEFRDVSGKATTFDEQAELVRRDPRVLMADDYLAFEEQHRGKDVGLAALQKLNNLAASVSDLMPKLPEARKEMYRRLAEHYIRHPDLDITFNNVSSGPQSPLGPELLKKAIGASPERTVQAAAIYNLASHHLDMADDAEMVDLMVDEVESRQPRDERRLAMLRQALEKLKSVDPRTERNIAIELAALLNRDYSDVREPQRTYEECGVFWRQAETAEQSRSKPGYGALAEGLLFDLQHLQIGMPAPDISTEKDGEQKYATQYLGKVTLVVFDYTFNGTRMGPLADWAKQQTDKPLDVLVVRTAFPGQSDDFDTAEFAPLRFITEENGGPIATQWNIRRQPTFFVVDGNGVIRARKFPEAPFHLIGELLKSAAAETDRVFVR